MSIASQMADKYQEGHRSGFLEGVRERGSLDTSSAYQKGATEMLEILTKIAHQHPTQAISVEMLEYFGDPGMSNLSEYLRKLGL